MHHAPLTKFGINNLLLFLALNILEVDIGKQIAEIPAVSRVNITEVDDVVTPLAVSRVYFFHCNLSSSFERDSHFSL